MDRLLQAAYAFKAKFQHRRLSKTEAVFLLAVIVVPISVNAGMVSKFAGLLNSNEFIYERQLNNTPASDLKLLTARTSPESKTHQGGGDVIVDDSALLSGGPFNFESSSGGVSNGEISIHVVRPCTEDSCETLSHIAEMYGISVNTILWANDISDPKSIQPGDSLIILPITGIRHVVKSQDTLASIAKKYGAETNEQIEGMVSDMITYNRLASAEDISVGDTVVVPGGVMHTATVIATPAKSSSVAKVSGGAATGGSTGFVHPLPGAIRTQGIHGYNAVDLAAAIGTPIRAAADGEVIVSKLGGWNGGYGSYIVIRHGNGTQTLYAHTSSISVSVGDTVSAGETIGAVGNTGQSTGPHLHFEVRGATNPF